MTTPHKQEFHDYITRCFSYLGCELRCEDHVLIVELTPELAQYFRKPVLRLVFHPEHLEDDTELVTYGSYIATRLYEIVKFLGNRVAVTLPKAAQRQGTLVEARLHPYRCFLQRRGSREIRCSEAAITFRITYYSDEKTEELMTCYIDLTGKIQLHTDLPYPVDLLQDATTGRFPFTRKQAQPLYEQGVKAIRAYAEEQSQRIQQTFSKHFHENMTRLEAYYRQMIEEVPALDPHRDETIRQLKDEYEVKLSDELHKCQIQVTLEPLSFCALTMPFRRDTYQLQQDKRKRFRSVGASRSATHDSPPQPITLYVYQNLWSGDVLYPRCISCDKPMRQVGICEVKEHPVCRDCLIECHECGAQICRDCGIDICFECGEWVCHACSEFCHICGERHCLRHLRGCLLCREYFCQDCAERCEICGKPTGKIHLTTCHITHKLACPACTAICSCCRREVSQTHTIFCAFCGQQACAECAFQCAVCGETFCVHHIHECEMSGQMVCPQHSGTCAACSRQVSSIHLTVCDVCKQPLCHNCAARCAQCGMAFCSQHSTELHDCPVCGERFCSLCYSEHVRTHENAVDDFL